MPSAQKPSQQDMQDAIEHADTYGNQGWNISDFSLQFLGYLTTNQLGQFDDLSSWGDLDPSDFEGLSDEEKIEQLGDFRGPEWAQRAATWLKTKNIPPIIVIEYPDPEEGTPKVEIGDGRGRVNLAMALGIKLPTWKMTYKGLKERKTMNKKEFAKLVSEAVAKGIMEYDRGDHELHQSANADSLLKQTDELLNNLKALAQTLHRKQDPTSLAILKQLNASLGPFVQKVTAAVRSGKM